LRRREALSIIGPFSGRLDHALNPDLILNTPESRAPRAKLHLAAPDRIIWLLVAAIVVWGVWAFGSELLLNLRLNQEMQQLRQGNAQLAASNDDARKELAAVGSPGALEEAARKAGFAKPGEQVYVIVKPSGAASPAAGGETVSPSPALARGQTDRTVAKTDGGVIGAIEHWWRNLWH
jgi:cell division protein FtsB